MMVRLLVLLAAALSVAEGSQFNYIPGMELKDYGEGDYVEVNVNSLHSHEALVSFDFYSLKFCAPSKAVIERFEDEREEKLGQVIWGERIEPSLYMLKMKQDQRCVKVACAEGQEELSSVDLRRFEKSINSKYRGNFVIDNLPVVSKAGGAMLGSVKSAECFDAAPRGWPLGVPAKCTETGSTHIHNHLEFQISVNEHKPGRWIIVAVNVVPRSVEHPDDASCTADFKVDDQHPPVTTVKGPGETKKIVWSYAVTWVENNDIGWNERWDAYLALAFSNNNERVHWVSIINSMLVILCLSVVVAMILLRTLHMDFNRYNNPESPDEQQEEMGWKLVHGDVFRNPPCPGLFAITIGTGVQLLGMLGITVSFALLGFLSPANRGGLITSAILLFVLMSVVNGIVTGTILGMFEKRKWKIVFGAGLAYPGILFCMWLAMELYIVGSRQGANTAPVFAVLSIMGLWFGVSLPLVVLGAGFGFNLLKIAPVTKVTSTFPRKIPPQRWYMELPVLLVVPGMVPFAAAFIEIRFILFSMWQGMVYYVFGFLAITMLAVLITAAEVSIVIVYFLLVFEDHRWWWRSLAIPGGMGMHFFLYSIYYYKTRLHIKTWLACFIYFETMAVISLSVWIAVGTIGFIASFFFVRAIYSRIKID